MPTTIPRVGLTLEAIFIPFGGTSVHPFTGAAAAEAGRDEIRDNGIEIEVEGQLPVETESPAKASEAGRKFSMLLAEEATRVKADAPLADEDDEPVLRLPDDD